MEWRWRWCGRWRRAEPGPAGRGWSLQAESSWRDAALLLCLGPANPTSCTLSGRISTRLSYKSRPFQHAWRFLGTIVQCDDEQENDQQASRLHSSIALRQGVLRMRSDVLVRRAAGMVVVPNCGSERQSNVSAS